jgi:environmental stress-induced protein Ves
VRIIRQASFTITPWKNGGGMTHEAIRVPAGADAFRWRVSIAYVDSSGPFSDFAGYNRKMVLLRGAGVALRFGDGKERELRQIGEMAEFDGGVSTDCRLLGGPCVDLNLMISQSTPAGVRVESLGEEVMVPGSRAESTLIFSIGHPLMFQSDTGDALRLEPWDLAVVTESGGRLRKIEPDHPTASCAVLFATIGN